MKKNKTISFQLHTFAVISAALLWASGCGGKDDRDVEEACDTGCLINRVCYDPGEENPENPCLFCDPTVDSEFWINNNGAPCDDGAFCNGADTCLNGNCSEHTGNPCPDDGLFCNGTEYCDGKADLCVSPGSPCADDGVFCNGVETCDEDRDLCFSPGDPCRTADDMCSEDHGQCCVFRDSLTCDEQGHVIWLDSCGRPGVTFDECEGERFTCRDGSCRCADGWFGPDCSQCVFFVSETTGSDDNFGRSWGQALATIQVGLFEAELDGCEIWVAAGTYYPTDDESDFTASFQLIPGIALYGGFAGDESNREDRDPKANETILSGDIDRNGRRDNGNSHNVVIGSDNAIIDGFTITGGNSTNWTLSSFRRGGGMYNLDSSPIVANCLFTDNLAEDSGGAMYNENSSPIVINCSFEDNSAEESAAAIHNLNSSPTITNSSFRNNRTYGTGAAIYNQDSSLTVVGCTFTDHLAYRGTVIYNQNSSLTMTNCTSSDNSSYHLSGTLTNTVESIAQVTNCIFWENTALPLPQIYVDAASTAIVTSSVVEGGHEGEGNIDTDPRLLGDASNDLRLQDDSPCIDAGDTSALPEDSSDLDGDGDTSEPLPIDIDGNPRVSDGDSNGTAQVDIGAYEFL